MKRLFFTLILTAVFVLNLSAVPAKRQQVPVTLATGEQIVATCVGDEFYRCLVTDEGKVLRGNGDGTFSISQENERQLRARAMQTQPRARRKTIGVPKALPKVLVVLVNFTDQSWNRTYVTKARDQLNLEGYNYGDNIGSVRDYFRDASNGQYEPQFDVYGPMTLAHNMAYYGDNDDANTPTMVLEAAQFVYDQGVDLSQYDSDGDGAVDFFALWYAGFSEAEDDGDYDLWGNWQAEHPYLTWPHQWELSDRTSGVTTSQRTFGNTMIDSYFVFSELAGSINSSSSFSGIGTFCHEFSHALGLPDLYCTSEYVSNSATMRDWDIMDYGPYNGNGCVPPTYSAYERYFMGWMTPTVLNSASNDTLRHILTANEAYMVSSDGILKPAHASQAYYLLENRQKISWDEPLVGAGLMITKITYNDYTWTENTVNNNVNSMGVDLIEAQSNNTGYSKATDLFPTTSKKSYSPYSKYPITEITRVEDGRIAFKFMGGASDTSVDPDPSTGPDPSGEPSDDECFEEFFSNPDGLGSDNGFEITNLLEDFCDNSGWTGEKVFAVSSHDGLRLGSSNNVGRLTTPQLGIPCAEMLVAFNFESYNNDNATVNVSVSGGGGITDIELVDGGNSYFTITNATESTQVTLSTPAKRKRVYITSFEACCITEAEDITALDNTQQVLDVIVKENGIELGDVVNVKLYNAMGQLMYQGCGQRFLQLPKGVYILKSDIASHKFIVR